MHRLNLVDSWKIAGIYFHPQAFGKLTITTADISDVNNNTQTSGWKIWLQRSQSRALLQQKKKKKNLSRNDHEMLAWMFPCLFKHLLNCRGKSLRCFSGPCCGQKRWKRGNWLLRASTSSTRPENQLSVALTSCTSSTPINHKPFRRHKWVHYTVKLQTQAITLKHQSPGLIKFNSLI